MAEQKKGWFSRLTEGLSRSSKQMTDQVVSVLTKMKLDEEALATLEESLIEADIGPEAAERITERFSEQRFGATESEAQIKGALAAAIAEELRAASTRSPGRDPTSCCSSA
jgi:fused signal recognition particle receptor